MDVGLVWATLIDRMQSDDRHRLSWCVRHDRTTALGDELVDELVEVCRDACATEFPSTDGYVTSVRHLSGALEGASITIARGGFWALISVQRYDRTQEASAAEIRMVASCRHAPTGEIATRERASSPWGLAGFALGTVGVGAAGLELSGLLSAWGQVLLLIPAFMAWRMCMALRIAGSLRQQARLRIGEDPAVARTRRRTRRQEEKRWQRLCEVLTAQRDAVAERFTLRPFRSPGAQPGSVGMRTVSPALPTALPPPVFRVPTVPI